MRDADDSLRRIALARVGRPLNDKYEIDALIGIGGMAAVYSGRHRNRNRVAIKILHPLAAAVPSVRTRFLREGYVGNTVSHRGVVRVLDDDVANDGAVFLVMELLEGETLDRRLSHAGGSLPVGDALQPMLEVLDVLAAAHERGIVHRDIKPENIFVTRDGSVKVLDFGIARLVDAAAAPTKTSSGAVLGTPAFMAPEQALGRTSEIDEKTDLYAVGATMFTLLSGCHVHEAPTAGEMIARAATKPAPSLGTVAPHLPRGIVAVVDGALAFERAVRWPDARTMREALLQAVNSTAADLPAAPTGIPRDARAPSTVSMSLVGATTGTRTAPPMRPLWRAAVLLGALVVAAAGAVVVATRLRGTSPPASAASSAAAMSTTPASSAAAMSATPASVAPAASAAPLPSDTAAGRSDVPQIVPEASATADAAPAALASGAPRPTKPGRTKRSPPSPSASASVSPPPAPTPYDPLGHQ
jgi:serine/threonine-protein kinase